MTYKPQLDKVSGTDTTPNFLIEKLLAGGGISITRNNAGGEETLTIAAIGAGGYADDNVSNPPTEQELTAAFGAPVTVGAGFYGLLNDSGAGSREYMVFSDGENWNYAPLARSVSSLGYASLTRYGAILEPALSAEEYYLAEPTVIIDNGLWKMWYRYGWSNPRIGYATSPDGITWTKSTDNPVIATALYCPFVFKDGSTYHLYAVLTTWDQYNHYTSTDGITWTLAQAGALAIGGSGAWDDYGLGNPFVWKEGVNDWRMLYEARGGDTDPWKIGYATSTDGNTWTKSGSNPVISETGSVGGPYVLKNGSTYYLWAHRSTSGFLPTDIVLYHSTDLTTWTDDGVKLARSGVDEGEGVSVGQVADPTILIHNRVMYLYYHASPDGLHAPSTPTGIIKLATAKEGAAYGD